MSLNIMGYIGIHCNFLLRMSLNIMGYNVISKF